MNRKPTKCSENCEGRKDQLPLQRFPSLGCTRGRRSFRVLYAQRQCVPWFSGFTRPRKKPLWKGTLGFRAKKGENETSRFRHHSPDNFVTLEKMRSTLLHRDATVKSRKELAYPSFFNYSNLVREQLTISKYRNLVVCA